MLWAYPVACLLFAALALVVIAGLDPYDTGRFALLGEHGVPRFGQRLTGASLARAPDTEAAILGNSTMQLISPERLAALTGWRFVSLTMTFSGPTEQLAAARWLVRHHDGVHGAALKALVFGIDSSWCEADGKLDMAEPFPFWLYSDSAIEYLRSLINMRGVDAVVHKLRMMAGAEPPLRADGYSNFEPEYATHEAAGAADLALGARPVAATGTGNFAAVPLLRDFLAIVPKTTSIAFVVVPHYYIDLPIPATPAAAEAEQCKAGYREIAASRPHTALLDFRKDDAIARDRRNFWDRNHYRMPIARMLEKHIAAALDPVTASGD
ncbi:MAG TPA: hypothetical protein VG651_12275 [Stellaceae bacterium]|nr:hypothetical protein [Stellaceae bacterium]